MNRNALSGVWLLCVVMVLILMPKGAFASSSKCAEDIKAITYTDADVSVQILALHAKPLAKCELEAEAQAWLLLLKDKVTEISIAEVAAIYKIVTEHELVLKNPEPVVRLHELADSSVNFICRPWAKPEDYWDVYWDITREVKRRFDAEGVSIPFPQRDVHLYQETS